MNIDEEIYKLIEKVGEEQQIMPYVYLNDDNFDKEKSTVLYGGPYWDKTEIVNVIKSLLIGKWLVGGNDTHLFESKFADKIHEKYALLVNSGSSANLVMITALKNYYKWNDGDEILTSAVGFPTTLSAIVQNNLKPVFLDIEMNSLNIDISEIEKKITNKTVALFLSPTLGNPPDIDKLIEICNNHNIKLVLDGCDSLGTKWNGKHLNEYFVATSESFYSAHTISTIQGGMVSSKNKDIIDIARKIAQWGKKCSCQSTQNLLPDGACNKRFSNWLSPMYDGIIDHRYVFEYTGYNLIPPEITGSMGLAQLEKLDKILEKRKYNYNIISNLFIKYIDGIRLPSKFDNANTAWFANGIICESKEIKKNIVKYLESNRIQTRHLFAGNLLLHNGYKHLGNYLDYPNANKVLDLVFFTGCPPHYGENILNYIEETLQKYDK
jgi:CDP-6-deoxy-D-xylo-4-hexulose-3-dehydrase